MLAQRADAQLVPDTTGCHSNDVALNDGGEFVMTASSDGTVKVWETMSGKPRATLRGTSQPVMCVDTVGSLVAGGCNDRICRIWDVGSERIRVSNCVNGPCWSLLTPARAGRKHWEVMPARSTRCASDLMVALSSQLERTER